MLPYPHLPIMPVPQGTPVSRIRFSTAELFTMLGGSDVANFIWTFDFTGYQRWTGPAWIERSRERGYEPWREETVRRLAPGGYVDRTGRPNNELAELLAPLAEASYAIKDGFFTTEAPLTHRRFCMFFYDGSLTVLTRLASRKYSFRVRSVPASEWASDLEFELMLFDGFTSSAHDVSLPVVGVDAGVVCNRLMSNDAAWITSFANAQGYSADILLETGRALQDNPEPFGPKICSCVHIIHRKPPSPPEGRYLQHLRIQGDFKCKTCFVFPHVGFAASECYAHRPGYPDDWLSRPDCADASRFRRIDWIGSRSLLDFMLDVPDYPEGSAGPWDPLKMGDIHNGDE